MPVFEYTARNLNGDLENGSGRPAAQGRCRRPPAQEPPRGGAGAAGAEGRIARRHVQGRGEDPRHRHLHAPVLDDDQLRPAAGAGARHSRQAEREQGAGRRDAPGRVRRRDRPHRSPTRCGSIPRRSPISTSTWSRPVRPAVFSTPFCMRLAEFMEKNDALVRKVKGAMIYPGVIMTVAAIAITVLLIFVIPTFQTMFASVAPRAAAADAHRHRLEQAADGLLVGAAGAWSALAVFGLNRYYATPGGKLLIDRLLLQGAGARRRAAQVGRVAFHAHAGHADLLRRVDSRRPRDHGADGRQPRHSGRDHGVARVDRRR